MARIPSQVKSIAIPGILDDRPIATLRVDAAVLVETFIGLKVGEARVSPPIRSAINSLQGIDQIAGTLALQLVRCLEAGVVAASKEAGEFPTPRRRGRPRKAAPSDLNTARREASRLGLLLAFARRQWPDDPDTQSRFLSGAIDDALPAAVRKSLLRVLLGRGEPRALGAKAAQVCFPNLSARQILRRSNGRP